MARTFLNLTQHQLVAIDTETTGVHEDAEILHFAAIPLDHNLEPIQGTHFEILIRPTYVDNLSDKVRPMVDQAMRLGTDSENAVTAFLSWRDSLNLIEWGRIVPLGHNYLRFDERLMRNWLGPVTYDHYFHSMVRDTMHIAGFLNDFHDYHARKPLFPDVKLSTLAARLGVEYDIKQTHNALYDALLTAKVYKAMMKLGDKML